MSLLVSIVAKDKDSETENLENEIQPPFNNLFGFENWRYTVWGTEIVYTLNCKLLYSLRHGNIYAYDEGVEILKNELITLISNSEEVSSYTLVDKLSIEFRIKNALEFIRVVEKHIHKVGVAIS